MITQSNNKFKLIKENIKALSNYFEEEKLKEEHRLEKKMNYIKIFENKINERFEEERAKREDMEFRIFGLINNKFNILFNEVNNESRNRNSCVENLKLYLDAQNKDNPDLKQALNKEKNSRIDNDNEVNEKISQELNNMENIIQDETATTAKPSPPTSIPKSTSARSRRRAATGRTASGLRRVPWKSTSPSPTR